MIFRDFPNQVLLFIVASIFLGLGSNWIRSDSISLLAKELETAGEEEILNVKPNQSTLKAINLEQALNLYNKGIIFVDARDEEYYNEGHIPRAFVNRDIRELIFNLDSLQGKDAPLVTYCDGDECGSSEELAYDLQDEGFTKIFVFVGGWSEWVEAGYSIEQ